MRSIEFQPLRLVNATDRVGAAPQARPVEAAKGGNDIAALRAPLAGSGAPPIDHERVLALRNAIIDGTYRIEPEQIASAMIETVSASESSR